MNIKANLVNADHQAFIAKRIQRQNGKRISSIAKKTLADVATSVCLVVFILVFMGISLKACEVEQAIQLERAKAHQVEVRK